MERIEQMQAIKLDRLGALEPWHPKQWKAVGIMCRQEGTCVRVATLTATPWKISLKLIALMTMRLMQLDGALIAGAGECNSWCQAIIKSFTEKRPEGQYRKSRPVSSVAENVRINRELWDIAAKVCQLA
jgi:hypothetical protein